MTAGAANGWNAVSAGIGALGNIAGGIISNAVGASTSKKLMKMQAALNYHYAKKSALNSPTWSRTGLENAGYNPMLAVQNATSGANSSWTSSSGVSQPDMGNLGSDLVANASQLQRLENETKQTDSTVNLQNEQASTEQAKRENLSFQNAMLDVEKHLKDKDLSTYDERFYTEMYKMMQEAEKMRQEASVVGYNAESQRIIANAQQTNAEVNKEWTPGKIASGVVTGLGVGALTAFGPGKFFKGAKAAKTAAKAAKNSKQVSSVIPKMHTFGKTRTH